MDQQPNLEIKQLTKWQKFIAFLVHQKWRFLASFLVGIVLMVLNNVANNNWISMTSYVNGSFIGGFALVCVSMLIVLESFGGMDIFSYQVNKKKLDNGTRETLYDYSNRRKKEREGKELNFIPYLVVGLLFIAFSVITHLIIN